MASAKKSSKSVIPVRRPAPKKAAPKATHKTAARAAAKAPVPAMPSPEAFRPGAATAPAAPKDKAKKPKLVRDSFTIPKAEFTVLQDLKLRAGMHGTGVKKSELLRAGIKALAAMNDAAFTAALAAVPPIKTGRPSKQ